MTFRFVAALMALVIGAAIILYTRLTPPTPGGVALVPQLKTEVRIAFDALGIPSIRAGDRDDAMRALGYVHARDRFFQMELMRRKSTGRLAEWFGQAALELDRRQRTFQFEGAALVALQGLPPDQRQALTAYVDGVNAYLADGKLPPELIALGVDAEPWRPEDSLHVAFGMFQTLTNDEPDERMLTVLERTLPAELVAFLTPDVDRFNVRPLAGGTQPLRPARPIPRQAWAALVTSASPLAELGGVDADQVLVGSNAWAVGAAKTIDGRAIVADDMHLTLGVPNLWYRAALKYGETDAAGVTIPGLPMIVVGSNRHVAWGFTNVEPDVMDFVELDVNPADPNQYRSPDGWQTFVTRKESIRVKGGEDQAIELRSTVYGPVAAAPLLGKPVALHWSALEPGGVDLGLLQVAESPDFSEAIRRLNRAGGPPQNAMVADDRGHIAWTLMGRLANRRGFDGSAARSWGDGRYGWDGFVAPEALPRVIDPPEGFVVTANQRTIGRDYPHVLGHNFAGGYRAFRIGERLSGQAKLTEADLLSLQLDTRSAFYDYYRDLALRVVADGHEDDAVLFDARQAIERWDGQMEAESRGIAILIRFRQKLAERVFAPVVARCKAVEPSFNYAWRTMDTPLQALLDDASADLLPAGQNDWRSLIRAALRDAAGDLKNQYGVDSLVNLPWGRVNHLNLEHPFSKRVPQLAGVLNMPGVDSPGCAGTCVRVSSGLHGATERMVVSPGFRDEGILHMPGGQSGNPLSEHYADQFRNWADGIPLPFEAGPAQDVLELRPEG